VSSGSDPSARHRLHLGELFITTSIWMPSETPTDGSIRAHEAPGGWRFRPLHDRAGAVQGQVCFARLQLVCSGNRGAPVSMIAVMQQKYQIKGVPTLVFSKPDGTEMTQLRATGFEPKDVFLPKMKQALEMSGAWVVLDMPGSSLYDYTRQNPKRNVYICGESVISESVPGLIITIEHPWAVGRLGILGTTQACRETGGSRNNFKKTRKDRWKYPLYLAARRVP
jgi:hypothetical protein